ncbi:hypothetical protein E2986_09053 [Frieseomelitta varia]|uniref:Uncharacterized protein n=1 Tax=Frieseomelitta varia TaxID=561572 RepID=A0A833VLW0_9HYME|nr:uncharacterized protein LOC122533875 [Frieseomelitta varia]KAF3423536.1 hypothetical protein E2986_09053 [Frieseomelitta varia]
MMVATYKCGCPPTEKKPCCKPCPSGRSTVRVLEERPASPGDCPKSACCNKRALKPTVSRPKVEQPPPCCPTRALDSNEFERPRKLRSEIAEKGLPYNEMEVAINDNRLVIRSQKEEVKPKYDPPCDCVDDPQPVPSHDDEIDQPPVPGTRTVTLYPQTGMQPNERDVNEKNVCPEERTTVEAENPNVFVLRVKRKSNNGDKRFDIDLEFKTPRPWSTKKRTEYETEWSKLSTVKEPSTTETDEVQVGRTRKKRKRKK